MTTVKMGMTIEEAAECSGIGRNTMRKLVEWKKLPVLKVGRKTIISEAEILEVNPKNIVISELGIQTQRASTNRDGALPSL